MLEIRTDLAFEAHSLLTKSNAEKINGISCDTRKSDVFSVTRVAVETAYAAEKIKKPVGQYITLHSEHIKSGLYTEELSHAFSKELSALLSTFPEKKLIMLAGLGNSRVTPDALGPKVTEQLIITRHIAYDDAAEGLTPVCALSPGVLGITGIETSEIFSAIVKKISPDLIIAIDALAASEYENLGVTIQLSDTGINPGSGVHNRRNALNQETLGVPVIAVGMPTVCDSSSVVYSALSHTELLCEGDLADLCSSFSRNRPDMMVTPKNIDALISRASVIISRGINMALQPSLTYDDVTDYTS